MEVIMNIDSVNKIALSEGHNLAGLVEYAPGAIVSREIVNKGIGTLTVFAFDAGQGLSEHSAPFDAIVQVLDGKSEWTIGGKAASCAAGEIMIMPANVPHGVKATERFKMLLTMIKAKKE
jgi:quercetin dioxygenase-like cupin family protein